MTTSSSVVDPEIIKKMQESKQIETAPSYIESSEFHVVGMEIRDFKGIKFFRYEFGPSGKLVVCGDHGSGKTNVTEANSVLWNGAAALKDIDQPVRIGRKKFEISQTLDGVGDVLKEFNVGNQLQIRATKTLKGYIQYQITDLESNKVYKSSDKGSPVKKIIETLRALWLDPFEFYNILKEPNGAKQQAEIICKAAGLDITPELEKREELKKSYTIENAEVDRVRGSKADNDEPQDDWPTDTIDPESISKEKDRLNSLQRTNEQNQQKIITLEKILEGLRFQFRGKKRELNAKRKDLDILEANRSGKLSEIKLTEKAIEEHAVKNPRKEWEGTPNIEEEIQKLQAKIQALLDEQKKQKEHEEKERKKTEQLNSLRNARELKLSQLENVNNSINEKNTAIGDIKISIKQIVSEIKESKENLVENEIKLCPIPWTGARCEPIPLTNDCAPADYFIPMFPKGFLEQKMNSVEANNELVRKRHIWNRLLEEEKQALAARDRVVKQQKANEAALTKKFADTDFKVRYLTCDEDRLYVELPGKPRVSLNDLNHADAIGICSEIVMANNKGPLKLLVIKEGYGCLPATQRKIFDAAFRWGYNVILETFVWTDDEDCVYMEEGEMTESRRVLEKVFGETKTQSSSKNKSENEMDLG